MSRLFTCGFEEGNFSTVLNAGIVAWTGGAGSSVTVVTTSPHSGQYHMRQPGGAANVGGPRRDLNSAKTSGTVFYRVYWNPATLPTSGTTVRIFLVKSGGASEAFNVRYNRTTGFVELVNVANASDTVSGGQAISAGTWYRIEVRHFIHDTLGELQMKLFAGDSTTPLDDIACAVGDTLPTSIQQIFIGSETSVNDGRVFYYDDVAINDDGTGLSDGQTSWCGPGKIALMVPASDTGTVQWTLGGSAPAATHFGGVSEVPTVAPDDGTTNNTDSGTTNVDRLGLTAMPSEVTSDATIILADTSARVSADAASQTMILRMWDESSATTDSLSISLGNGTWATTTSTQHLVVNTAGKTKANLNNFNIGYKGNSGASAKRVSVLWTNVEWLEATGPPPAYDQGAQISLGSHHQTIIRRAWR